MSLVYGLPHPFATKVSEIPLFQHFNSWDFCSARYPGSILFPFLFWALPIKALRKKGTLVVKWLLRNLAYLGFQEKSE